MLVEHEVEAENGVARFTVSGQGLMPRDAKEAFLDNVRRLERALAHTNWEGN